MILFAADSNHKSVEGAVSEQSTQSNVSCSSSVTLQKGNITTSSPKDSLAHSLYSTFNMYSLSIYYVYSPVLTKRSESLFFRSSKCSGGGKYAEICTSVTVEYIIHL